MSDHVLIPAKNHAPREIYHEPDPDNPDRPKCSDVGRKDGEFVRKDPGTLPNRRVCKQCTGDVNQADEYTSHYATLENMDPEAI